jgi:flagellar hook-basal body complex protein FliE
MSMAISPITTPATALTSALSGITDTGTHSALSSTTGSAASPFADLMTDTIDQVDQLESQAQTAVTGLMTGTGVDVHQAMIAAQKADMAFELALSVRNKAVQAYQSVIGMQF